jgi:hypothetical protein
MTYCDILVQNRFEEIWGHSGAEFVVVLVLHISFVFLVKHNNIRKSRPHFTVHI